MKKLIGSLAMAAAVLVGATEAQAGKACLTNLCWTTTTPGCAAAGVSSWYWSNTSLCSNALCSSGLSLCLYTIYSSCPASGTATLEYKLFDEYGRTNCACCPYSVSIGTLTYTVCGVTTNITFTKPSGCWDDTFQLASPVADCCSQSLTYCQVCNLSCSTVGCGIGAPTPAQMLAAEPQLKAAAGGANVSEVTPQTADAVMGPPPPGCSAAIYQFPSGFTIWVNYPRTLPTNAQGEFISDYLN